MIDNSKKPSPRLLAASLLSLLAACNVNASGQIPCADDSSCPASYPRCDPTHVCVTGTPTLGPTTIAFVGVTGHSPADILRLGVQVAVTARATTGVQNVSLAGGGKTYTSSTASAPPLYLFDVNTLQLADGDVTFTATVTAGDASTATATSTLHIRNAPPVLSVGVVGTTEATDGTLVAIDVTGDEALTSVSSTISGTTNTLAEIAPASGLTRHFGYAVTAGDAEGPHDVTVSGTDSAGNSGSKTLVKAFNVRHPFSFGAVSVTGQLLINNVATVSPGHSITVTTTLPNRVTLGSGVTPAFVLAGPARTVNLPTPTNSVGATVTTWTTTYPVVAADGNGLGTVTVSVTDVAGNKASQSGSVSFNKTPPALSAISLSSPFVAVAPAPSLKISFTTDQVPATVSVTVNGHTASQVSGAGSTSYVYSYSPGAGDTAGALAIVVSVSDALGNTSTDNSKSVIYDAVAPSVGALTFIPTSKVVARGQLQQFSFTVTDNLQVSSGFPVVTVTPLGGSAIPAQFVSRTVNSATSHTFTHQYLVGVADSDGTATISITAADAAGNTGPGSGSFTIASTPPTLAPVTAAPLQVTTGQTVTFTIGVTDCHASTPPSLTFVDAATSTTRALSVTQVSAVPGASCLITYTFTHVVSSDTTAEPDGNYRVTVIATDDAGNTSTANTSFQISRTGGVFLGPLSLASPFVARSPAPVDHLTFLTSTSPNGNPTVTVGSQTITTFTQTNVSGGGVSFDYTFNSQVADTGSLTVTVQVKDSLNNTSTRTTSVTVDNIKPVVGTVTASSPVTAGSASIITFSVTKANPLNVVPVVSVTPRLGSPVNATYVSGSGNGPYTFQYVVQVTDQDGTAAIVVTATDQAGNQNASSNGNGSFVIKSTPPTLSAVTLNPTSPRNTVTVSVTVTDCYMSNFPVVKFYNVTSSTSLTSSTTPATGSIVACTASALTYTHTILSNEANGDLVAVTVVATDDAGNVTSGSASYLVDKAAPTVVSDSYTPAISNLGSTSLVINFDEPAVFTTAVNTLSMVGPSTVTGFLPTSGSGVACNPCTFTITGLAAGTWHYSFTPIDAVGNTGSTVTGTSTFVRDTTAPTILSAVATPSVGITSPIVALKTGTVSIAVTASKALASMTAGIVGGTGTETASCVINSTNKSLATCTTTSVPTGASGSAFRNVTITATDLFGNTNAGGTAFNNLYVVDNVNPTTALAAVALAGGGTQTRFANGTALAITVTVSDVPAGLDPNIVPVMTIGTGLAARNASVLSATSAKSGNVVTSIQYVYAYTLSATGSECSISIAPIAMSGITDVLGNTGSGSAGSILCDNVAPTVVTATYNRLTATGSSVTYNITASLTSGANGSLKVFSSLANAQSNTSPVATVASTPFPLSGTVSLSVADSSGNPYLYLRILDTFGLVTIARTTVKTIALDLTQTNQKQYSLQGDLATKPASPSAAIAGGTVMGTPGTAVAVGVWERNVNTPPANLGVRMRTMGAYDPNSHKFFITGGGDATGLLVNRAETYVFDASNKTWTTTIASTPTAATACTLNTGHNFRMDAQMAYDPITAQMVVYGGRCESTVAVPTTAVTIPAADAIQTMAVPGGTTWANPGLLLGSTPNSGAIGALFYDDFLGGMLTVGFNDPGSQSATSQSGLLYTRSGLAFFKFTLQTGTTTNRFGAGSAVDPTLLAASGAMFGGLTQGATGTFAAGNSGSAFSDSLRWNGTSWVAVTPVTATPSARAYPAMAADTISSTVLMYAGTSGECNAGISAAANFPFAGQTGSACAKVARADMFEYLPLGNSGAGDWRQVFFNVDGSDPQTTPTGTENGASFHGFFDAPSRRFFVYRPLLRQMDDFVAMKSARVLVAFDSSMETVSNAATALAVTITTDGEFNNNATGVANSGTNVYLWDFTLNAGAGNWALQDGTGSTVNLGQPAAGAAGTPQTRSNVSVTTNPGNNVQNGKVYLLIETSTVADSFDYKSVAVTSPSVVVTYSTP
jgi:hypothetical protein